ncbi:MAG TPA: sulfite exporter TauE/SafE family protein [Desulfuromonadaceae bacterium]|jgi:hypothetical protein
MESLTHHIWIGLAGGLFAFAHCIGMCGGFVLHLAQEPDRVKMAVNQLLWLTGKTFTYTFLGAVAGYAGGLIEVVLFRNTGFLNILSFGAGSIMFLMGIVVLGLLPVPGGLPGSSGNGLMTGLCKTLLRTPRPGAALFLGMATAWLPCPIVIALLAYALQTGSVLKGMATMAGMGIGTAVPLLLLGTAAGLGGVHIRKWGARAGGVILLFLGLTTVLRGTEIYHQILGCPPKPALHQAQKTSPPKPCCTGKNHASGNSN